MMHCMHGYSMATVWLQYGHGRHAMCGGNVDQLSLHFLNIKLEDQMAYLQV